MITPKVVSKDEYKEYLMKWEDNLVSAWKDSNPLAPKMLLKYLVTIRENYSSTVGEVLIQTPFWRGELFSKAILLHEFLHWSIYPKDIFTALRDVNEAKELLKGYKKDKKKEIPLCIIQFCENILGDYIVNSRIYQIKREYWNILWTYLVLAESLEKSKGFSIYVASYQYLLDFSKADIRIILKPELERKAKQIANIVKLVKNAKLSHARAIAEITKIFLPILEEEQKKKIPCKSNCPKCNNDEFEILEVYK